MVNFYYRVIRQPMLAFKKEISIEVSKRQDIDRIVQEIDAQITKAESQFLEEMEMNKEDEEGSNDATSKNVKKLERKVNNLAKSIHDLFLQFDDL